jgi:hypothetical protein
MKQDKSAEVLQEAIDIGLTDVIVIGKINGMFTMLTAQDEMDFNPSDEEQG